MTTFTTYIPAGWVRIDLTRDPSQDVAAAVTAMLEGVPADRRALVRRIVRERLTTSASELAAGGAAAMLLPVNSLDGPGIRPTIVFMPLTVPPGRVPMDVLLSVAASDPSARVIDVDGLVAARTQSEVDVTDRLVDAATAAVSAPGDATPRPGAMIARRVRYVLGDPGDSKRWIDIFAGVDHPDTPEHREVADSAVELCDAIITTFRWTR